MRRFKRKVDVDRLLAFGPEKTVYEWAEEFGCDRSTLYHYAKLGVKFKPTRARGGRRTSVSDEDRALIHELAREYHRLTQAADAVSPAVVAQKFDRDCGTVRKIFREVLDEE